MIHMNTTFFRVYTISPNHKLGLLGKI